MTGFHTPLQQDRKTAGNTGLPSLLLRGWLRRGDPESSVLRNPPECKARKR